MSVCVCVGGGRVNGSETHGEESLEGKVQEEVVDELDIIFLMIKRFGDKPEKCVHHTSRQGC